MTPWDTNCGQWCVCFCASPCVNIEPIIPAGEAGCIIQMCLGLYDGYGSTLKVRSPATLFLPVLSGLHVEAVPLPTKPPPAGVNELSMVHAETGQRYVWSRRASFTGVAVKISKELIFKMSCMLCLCFLSFFLNVNEFWTNKIYGNFIPFLHCAFCIFAV